MCIYGGLSDIVIRDITRFDVKSMFCPVSERSCANRAHEHVRALSQNLREGHVLYNILDSCGVEVAQRGSDSPPEMS